MKRSVVLKRRATTGLAAAALGALFCQAVTAAPTGHEIYEEVLAGTSKYDDPELTAYIEDLGRQIVSVSEKKGEKFTFTLLDSPDLNAFATADNYVYVNRGLLTYVNNEAQLVSVLAHEVGHVTKEHVSSMQSGATGAKVLATIAAVLAGSNEVYEAGMAYANSLVKGHGRDNELEADQAGAAYMAALGYDPNEMIGMLSIMKDFESLQKARARESGAPKQTYHGIFASHPRNDARLRGVVSKASTLKSANTRENGETRYRQLTEGLVWGENWAEKEKSPARYSNMKLRVRFDYPEGWTLETDDKGIAVTGQPASKDARLTMAPQPRTAQEPEEYLYNYLDSPQLRDTQAISPARLKGFTGILPGEDGKPDQRIAVVYYKLNAYIFSGEVTDQENFASFDEQFMESISTFRPISSREIAGQKPKTIHYVKATASTTFEALARELKLSDAETDDLRLVNGYYPSGEPKPGEWIKIFRQ
jgi:predicted Zn-dependent protease